jgi:hypothetical protein
MNKPATISIAPKVTPKVTPEVAPVVAAPAALAPEAPKPSVPEVVQTVSLKTQAEQQAGRDKLAAYRKA